MLMKHFTCLDEIYSDLDRVSQLKMRGAASVQTTAITALGPDA